MKKLFTIFLTFLLFASFNPAEAQFFKRKKKVQAQSEQKADSVRKAKVSTYEKMFIKDKNCETARGNFITLHKLKGKLYFEIPVKYLGREMLIASTISEASDNELGVVGFKPKDPMHVKFVQIDSTIYLSRVNIPPIYDESDKSLSRAMELASLDPMLGSYKIVCYNKDSSALVLDMTSMFVGNYEALSPMASNSGMITLTGTFNSSGAALDEIKAFDDNVTIKSYLSYSVNASFLVYQLKKNYPFTMKVTRTVMLLPEKPMQPRLADARIGIFLTDKSRLAFDKDQIDRFSVINRWRIEPSDPEAYARGELVEPVKPIVFYLDDAMPELWKEPAREGILRWNKAFEKIGFKNAIQVLDFPKDDPDFDPDNLKYSCIRYVPSAVSNAMGPSWVDPRSGEIINASVIVFNDVVKLLNQWRFIQTAQVDPRVRDFKLPDDVMKESIAYILSHEVGHCLGFMHNMAASAAYPVDSLRSAAFTQKYGTTPSIMDYARFNYVAQPGDKGVRLTPPDLGVYDEYLVKYAYCPVPDKDMFEELPVIRGWVDEKVGDPRYRYGKQQLVVRYDPSAIEEDLGDDPVKAADYGIANLKYILAHFDEWLPVDKDPENSHRVMTYENIGRQFDRYVHAAMGNIGGIYLTEVNAGTNGGPRAVAVPRERQKEALHWCIKQIKECDWLADKKITDQFPLRVELPMIVRYYLARDLFDMYRHVMLSAHIARTNNPYTPEEYFDDLYKEIWESAIKGRPITDADRFLQRLFVEGSCEIVTKKSQLVKIGSKSALSMLAPSVDQIDALGLDPTGQVNRYLDLCYQIDEQFGRGTVAETLARNLDQAYGYGWQYKLNLRTLDESKTYFLAQNKRILKLLKSRVGSSSGATRAHYEAMIYMIEQTLNH